MGVPKIGEPARSFRLPAAQGGEIGIDDYKGRQAVVLWFTKGMSCPFCRQQMSQLKRAYPQIKEHGGEVIEVTTSTPARGQFYERQFKLPFPYLCDPDYRVFSEWGLAKRSHGPGYYAKLLVGSMKMPAAPNDFGDFKPTLREVPGLLADEDMGLFIIDRGGTVRYALSGPYRAQDAPDARGQRGVHSLPGPDEIVRELQRCAAAA
jgi:peroxiredoxin